MFDVEFSSVPSNHHHWGAACRLLRLLKPRVSDSAVGAEDLRFQQFPDMLILLVQGPTLRVAARDLRVIGDVLLRTCPLEESPLERLRDCGCGCLSRDMCSFFIVES